MNTVTLAHRALNASPSSRWGTKALARIVAATLLLLAVVPTRASAQSAFLGKAEISLYGIGLKVQPETQTVPKGYATIVSTFLQAATAPGSLPPFPAGSEVRATLRGPSFAQPVELAATPNSPLNIPILTVPGTHTVENIRLVSNGEVLLYGSPENVTIQVIDKLLVTTVTARPLTADEIREKGIVYDKTNFQAYNFTAAFAVDDGSKINIAFPVVLPTLAAIDSSNATVALQSVNAPLLKSLQTLIPDTLQIQARIPNLQVVGFSLALDESAASQDFFVPKIPGVIVIPGDIGFLNQFFSVMLMVANVAPDGSSLAVSDLTASIVLPPGQDNVVGSTDDPLAMAKNATGLFPTVVPVTQPGPDTLLGTGDDLTTLGPGQTGNAEFLVEGRREGTHVVEMELAGTLNGLPTGPVPIRGRAAGAVLVRNPKFTLTFTHPDVVNAGEAYTLDVTVTNTSTSPANVVSVNLFPANISGATLTGEPSQSIDSIAPGDSSTVTFNLRSNRTGTITAATLDSDENVAGRFVLKSAVGELGVPLSPDSLILPKEANGLPANLKAAALGMLGRAWAVATAPPAALPRDLTRFSKQLVIDRAVQVAEAGFRVSLGETVERSASTLLFDFLGAGYADLSRKVPAGDTTGLLASLQGDLEGFDLVRRLSVRGDVFADAVAAHLAGPIAAGGIAFHQTLATQLTASPQHLSVLVASASGLPVDAVLVDHDGRRSGDIVDGKTQKAIPFSDSIVVRDGTGLPIAQLLVVTVPQSADYRVELTRKPAADPGATYDVSVAYPASGGGLQFASWPGVLPTEVPVLNQPQGETPQVVFRVTDVAAPSGHASVPAPVQDPPPSVLGAVQIADADVAGCPQDNRVYPIGRVVAVLFSEEVTAESVQDKLAASNITAFTASGNRVVAVALQPGGRIAYVALREPIGPFVARTITIEGATDRAGHPMTSAITVPIAITVGSEAGVVSGRILKADGTPAGAADVRMFYEFSCGGEATVVGVAEEIADINGNYQFDYVLNAPGMTVRLDVTDPSTEDARSVRLRLARSGQRLNADVVMLGRGTVTGRTLAEDGKTLLAGTALRITSLTDQSQYAATTDLAGTFTVSRIPVGNLLIEAVNVDRPAQVFVSENIPFAGATVTRDLRLLDPPTAASVVVKTGTLTGRVLRADGVTPLVGVPVVAYYVTRSQTGVACSPPPGGTSEPGECAIAVVRSDAQGLFRFENLTAGQLRVNTFDQTDLLEGDVRVVLSEQEVRDITILLSGGFGTVHGVVLDASHNPVPDAVVGGGYSLVNVGPDGTFTLTDVPVGRRRIVAASNALQSTGEATVDIVHQGETVNTTIVMPPVGAVAGIVRNRDGLPQAGIRVYVLQDCFDELGQSSVCVIGETVSDANGGYRVNKLGIGQYRVSAFRADLGDGNVFPIAIRYDRQVLIADVTFRGGFGTVKGRVLRAETSCASPPCVDTPLPARVAISGDRLVTAGGKIGVKFEYVQNYEVVSNDFTTGEYQFSPKVWTGPFTVRAAGQFSPEPVAAEGVMPGPGQTVTIDLRLQPTSRVTGTVFEPDGFTPVTNRQIALKFQSNAVVVFCHDDAVSGDTECTSIPQGIQEAFAATDANGQFSFPIVNAGPFTLTATDAATGKVASVKASVRAGDSVDVPMRLLGRAPVTVRVFRSNGVTPVVNARVSLQGLDYPQETRNGIAVNGTLDFAGADALSEGQFIVTAIDANGFAGRKSGRVTTDGTGVTVDVFLFDATGSVAGQVVRADATGALVPASNAEVIVSNASGPLAFALTDGQGNFNVSLIPTGDVAVEAFDPVTAGRGRAQAVVLGGTQTAFLTVSLEALGSIRGTVVQSGSLAPLKGWTVQLFQTTASGRSLPAQITQTGVDGSFSFPGAAVGSFYLYASRRDVVGSAAAGGSLSRGGQLLDIPLVVDIVRRVTGSVSGLVVNPQGSSAPNAQVDVCPQGEPCRSTLAGNDGRFLVPDLALGRFTVRASAQVTGNPSVGTTGGTLLFENDTADVTVTLLGLSTIDGTVMQTVNGARVPAPNATVRLFGQPGSGCQGYCQQGTDVNGQFHFVNVPAQTFTIYASSLTGQSGSIGDVLVPGQTKQGLQIVLAPSVSLTGRALLANGSPAGGIVIDLTVGGGHLFAESAPDGTFTFDALGGGAYALLAQDPLGPGLAKRSGAVDLSGPMDIGDVLLDEAPPSVADSVPAAGALNVSRTPEIRVTFTEPLDAGTVTAGSVTLTGPAGPVAGLVDTVDGDSVARFRLLPGVQLVDQARYTLRITNSVEDRVGRRMAADYVLSFTTVDVTPPSIADITPVASATGVAVDSVVRVRFSEIIDPSKFAGVPIQVTGPQGSVAGRVDYLFSNTVVVFTPNAPLADTTRYNVTVLKATDLTGLVGASDATYAFDTTDRTPPAIVSLTFDGGPTAVQDTTVRARATVAEADISVVDFFLNGAFAYAARTAPFVMDFKAAGSLVDAGGQIKVTAVATDTSGNRGVVPVQTMLTVVPDQAPTVAITQPLATLLPGPGERVSVTLHASDDVGVKEVSYSARALVVIDAATRQIAPAAQDRSESFGFNVPADAIPGSTITIQGTALDTAGHVAQAAPLVLRVRDTVGPTVQITGISSGQRVAPGATVTAVVAASDVSGVARIGFEVSGVTASTTDRQVVPVQSPVATSFRFVVPANATSADRVFLDAYAEDAAGNRSDAARLIVPVADRQAPTVTLRTASGTNSMVPGGTVQVIADAQDDLAIATIQLTGSGAFVYTETQSLAIQSASATAMFTLNVPNTLANGDTETVTARTTDASGNVSTPVSLTLTAQTVTAVTMPSSVLMLAGDQTTIDVTLGAPAPAGGVRVDLVSESSGIASVGPSLFFGQGETTKSATLHAVSGGTAQIDASIDGTPRANTTVTVSGGVVRGDVSVATPTGFQAVAGAQVTIFHAGTPLTTVTDAQGRFVVEGVHGADYSGRSFSVSASDGSRLDVESFQLDVPNGSATVSLNLLEMGVIQGAVYQPDVTTPAGSGVRVDLFEAAAPGVVIATTFTDASGNYQFPLVAPGPYLVDASDADGNHGRASAQLSSGQQLTVPVVYLGRATVTVHVVNGAGANVPGAVVQFYATSLFGGAPARTGNTDANGLVAFPNVFVGAVSATATDAFTNQGGSTSGQVTANGQATTLTIQFAQYGNLTGTILRRDGVTTAPGTQVTADFYGLGRFSTTADANGIYRFQFLPVGAFTLTVFDPATRGRAIDSGSFSTSGETLTRNETLLPQGALLVSVIDADGLPVNGASVTASTSNQGLVDALQGATGVLNGNAGQLLLDKMLTGAFSVQVSANGLTGSATGTLAADEVHGVTVQLESRATVAGLVFEPDGLTPAAGFARVVSQTTGLATDAALVDGAFSVPNQRLGTYRVEAYDAFSRLRAAANGIVLSANGQVQEATLTFVGLGTVQGRVLHPTGGDAGNLSVSLRSLNSTYGGYAQVQTDAAGNFVFTGVPVGGVSLSSSKPSEQLLGEAAGAIVQHNQVLSLDILLEANAIALPTSLSDVQDSTYGINQNGGLYAGTGSVFARGGANLTLSSGGATVPFSGAGFGTREEAGREIAVRESNLLGLNVTRKIFVPSTGYFARYLEILQNPGSSPVTVSVNLTSKPYGQTTSQCCIFGENPYFVASTSSGDSTLDASTPATADNWASLGVSGQDAYYDFHSGVPLGFAFTGSGAAVPATVASFATVQNVPTISYGWSSITVPANGTVALMHFVSEQASISGATASAQRLAQLPPEALDGLSAAEISEVVNFSVPANGASALAPLPSVTGSISGRVLEGDSVTPVPGAHVTFRSANPVLTRVRKFDADSNGAFSLSGGIGHPVPIDGFTLSAQHTVNTYTVSPSVAGTFAAGLATTTQDVVFSDRGVLKGIVRRHTGAVAAGAQVEVVGLAYFTTGADGRYSFGGVFTGTPLLRGTVPHPQGTSLNIVPQTVALAAGQVRDDVLLVEPTGTVTGTVLDADGYVQVSRPVTLSRTNFARYATTDSAGRFAFTDVPEGTFTVTSSDPVSGFPTSQQVTLAQDQTQDATLRYIGKGTLNVTVTRAAGALLPGMSVSVSAAGVNTQTRTTDANGVAGPFTDLPLGQLFTITASHPGNPYVLQTSTTLTLVNNAAAATLAMPAFGTVATTVSRPNGTLPGAGINAQLQNTSGSSFFAQANTDANSQVAFGVVPVGRPFTIRAYRPPTVQFGPSYALNTAPISLTTDGQSIVVPTHYPAVAKVAVTVQNAGGVPIANARVEERDVYNGYLQFRANTDAGGRVDITEVPEGAFDLRVYQPGSATNVLELATFQVATADDAGTVSAVVTAQSYAVTVTGKIFEHDGLTGLASVQVRLLRGVDGTVLASTCTCNSNPADGTFTFQNVASTGAGLVLQAFSPADFTTYTTPVVPVADGVVTANLSLPVFTARLEGHVYAADGVTPVGGGVLFPYTFTGRSSFGATIAADGSYQFAPAVYPIEGVRLEYNLSGLAGGKVSVNTMPFTQSGQTVTTDIVLPTGIVATIKGTAVAGDGSTPLYNSSVELNFASGNCSGNYPTCTTNTDQQGHFQFLVALPNDGQFTVRAHSPKTSTNVGQAAGTGTTQGATVDVGAVTVPISMLSAFATNGASAPVQNLTALVTDASAATSFADAYTGSGSFLFYELPAGNYRLTVQNTDAATDASVDVTMPTSTSVVSGVQVRLPIVGTVQVHVFDENGHPSNAATIALQRPSGNFERIITAYQGGLDQYRFEDVALGDYTVQGTLDTCDQDGNNCLTRYAETIASVVDENQVDATVSFAAAPHALVQVQDGLAQPRALLPVQVSVQSLAATGALGSFGTSFAATTDGNGIVQIPYVPEGDFAVRVAGPDGDVGTGSGTASAVSPAVVEVQLSFDSFELNASTFGALAIPLAERYHTFDRAGTLRYSYRWDGSQTYETDAFYSALELSIGGDQVCCALTASYSDSAAELAFGPVAVAKAPGVVQVRRLRGLLAGNLVRVLDTFTNTSAKPQTFTVSELVRAQNSTTLVASVAPSTTTGGLVVLRDPGGQSPAFGVVFAGVDAPVTAGPAAVTSSATYAMPTSLTLPPGQSVALLNYLVMSSPADGAGVLAEADALTMQTEPEMLAGLSRSDILRIVNFRITPPPPGPATVRVTVVAPDGTQTTGASVALVGSVSTTVRQPYEDNAGVFEFAGVAPGAYIAQASLENCDQNGCATYFTQAPVTTSSDTTSSTLLSFAALGRATIAVVDDNLQPISFEKVDVEIQSLSAVGPLGGYRTSFNADLDADGAFSIDTLPPGRFVVHIYSSSRDVHGTAIGTATKFAATTTQVVLSYDVVGLNGVSFSMNGSDGFYYAVGSRGTVEQSFFFDGSQVTNSDAFSVQGFPHSGAAEICCPLTAASIYPEVVLAPIALPQAPGVLTTRRMLVPNAGRFLRYYDVFTNTSAVAWTVPVSEWTVPNLSTTVTTDVTPSATTGGYFVRSDGNGQGLAFGVVYAGVDPPIAVNELFSDDGSIVEPTAVLHLAPGQSVALLHYVLLRAPDAAAEAVSGAEALATLSDPDALTGLTTDDLALIVNFRVSP